MLFWNILSFYWWKIFKKWFPKCHEIPEYEFQYRQEFSVKNGSAVSKFDNDS